MGPDAGVLIGSAATLAYTGIVEASLPQSTLVAGQRLAGAVIGAGAAARFLLTVDAKAALIGVAIAVAVMLPANPLGKRRRAQAPPRECELASGPPRAVDLGPHPRPLIARVLALRLPAPDRSWAPYYRVRAGQRPGGEQCHAAGAKMHLHVKISP